MTLSYSTFKQFGIMLVFILVMATVCRAAPASLATGKTSWHLSARTATYDQEQHLYVATGEVILSSDTVRLDADHVTYNYLTRDARATGHVKLISGKDTINCDAMDLNLETQTGTIMNGVVFVEENHFYISGNRIEKTGPASYKADRASLTSCAGDHPDWKITGRDISVTIEGYGTAKHATLWAGNIPALYTPIMAFPVKNQRQTGLLSPRITSSDRKGMEYDQSMFVALSRSTDATLNMNYMSYRGIKLGAEYRYIQDNSNKGTLFLDYLKDNKIDDGTDTTSDYAYAGTSQRTNADRYWLRMKNDREIFPLWKARLDLDYVSDEDYLHEFKKGNTGLTATQNAFKSTFGRELDDYDDTTRINQLNIKRAWSNYNLNMDALWYDNVTARQNDTDDSTLQSLPAITFSGMRQNLGNSPLYFELNSGYTHFFRQNTTDTLLNGQRMDLYPKIYLPFRLGGVQLEPSLGLRQTLWYTDDAKGRDDIQNGYSHREIFDINMDISTVFTRIFSLDTPTDRKIKHEVTPALNYTFIPQVDQTDIPWFDDTDLIEEQNTLTWQLTQRLTSRQQMKKSENQSGKNSPGHSYRELGWLKISQDYHLSGEDEDTDKPFSDIMLDLELSPIPHLFLDTDLEWSPYSTGISSHNSAITITDFRQDRISVQYRYSQADEENDVDETESIYTSINFKLNPGLRAFLEYEKNLYEDETIEATTGIEFNRTCWSMQVSYTDTTDDQSIGFLINLKGLGEFGTQ
ncbi:LPS-assembly protein LptD [Desulfocicer niacini]